MHLPQQVAAPPPQAGQVELLFQTHQQAHTAVAQQRPCRGNSIQNINQQHSDRLSCIGSTEAVTRPGDTEVLQELTQLAMLLQVT